MVRDILARPSIATKLTELFQYAGDHAIPLYVLIDEYDNFANTVLAHHGAEAYHDFTHGDESALTIRACEPATVDLGAGLPIYRMTYTKRSRSAL